jgi:hypothetical protein
LEQRVAQWSDAQTLADIFSEMVTFYHHLHLCLCLGLRLHPWLPLRGLLRFVQLMLCYVGDHIGAPQTVYLKAYNPYISSYTNAMDTIDRYMTNSAFVAFQNVRDKHPLTSRRTTPPHRHCVG